jgi:hypothetical protein
LFFPILAVAGILIAPLGFAGGMIYGFLHAACAGTYLATLQDALSTRRSISFDVIRRNVGAFTWDVIGALFPIWVAELLLNLAGLPSVVGMIFALLVFLLLNPVPELIGRSRTTGIELLREAWNFMWTSGPEWIIPHVLLLGVAWAIFPSQALVLLKLFGPELGFVSAGILAMGGQALLGSFTAVTNPLSGTALSWAVGFLLVALVHLVMLFRGALFTRLASGSRRGREWEQRFR